MSWGWSEGPALTGLYRGSNRCPEDPDEISSVLRHPVWAGWLVGAVSRQTFKHGSKGTWERESPGAARAESCIQIDRRTPRRYAHGHLL